MGLSDKEIEKLVVKLRGRYNDYAGKYSRAWFNIDAFEERFAMALKNRMNLEAFILAEISNFEKTREKYEKKKSEKPFSALVDSIIEENTARIKKYPAVYFHSKADPEMTHFYGAISDFALNFLPVLWLVVRDPGQRDGINRLESTMAPLTAPVGKKHSKRILDHILVLSRPASPQSDLDTEKSKNGILKEGAFILHEITDFCDMLIGHRDPEWEMPLKYDHLHIEGDHRKHIVDNFSGMTGYGAILRVRDYASSILEDFRLGAFRRKQ
jgi:hypothetical protein